MKVYFYSNKDFGFGEGGSYREIAACTIQYFNGTSWVDVPSQTHSPRDPSPNFNEITFAPFLAQQLPILVTRMTGYAVGIKEMQVFNDRSRS